MYAARVDRAEGGPAGATWAGLGVGAQPRGPEAAHEHLAGQVVEVVRLDALDRYDGDTRGAGDFLHAHGSPLARSLQPAADRVHCITHPGFVPNCDDTPALRPRPERTLRERTG